MTHASLFSGIGGFDLAAEWAGWTNVFHCEWMPFNQRVLKYHFPESVSYGDITKTDFREWRGTVDVLSGGFPCQPFSTAGKRKGTADDRHLWPEMLRAIREIAPRWIVGENVRGLVNWSDGLVFEQVCADLETEGYEVWPVMVPACAVNAPHRRDRIWFVAYSNNARGTAGFGQFQGEDEEVSQRDNDAEFGNASNGPTTNSEQPRLEGPDGFGLDTAKQFAKCFTPNTNSNQRCEGGLHAARPEQAERHFSPRDARGNQRTTWDNFPTQPPVRGGDDGLSRELDGITFSKWRNESIKGYGNAIVPQVALQIFESINEYENT